MMTKPKPSRTEPIAISTSKSDPNRRFAEIKSRLLDLEALLEELMSSQAHSNGACDAIVGTWPKALCRELDQWKLLDERWLQLRPLLQYACFAELEAAFFAAHADARLHPRTRKAKDLLLRLKVLWFACVDKTRPADVSASEHEALRTTEQSTTTKSTSEAKNEQTVHPHGN